MKKKPLILILAGLGLLIGLYFMPVKPSSPPGEAEKAQRPKDDEERMRTDQNDQSPASGTPDEQVRAALQKMQSGDLPPMQAVLKIRDIAEKHPRNVMAQMTLGAMSMQTGQYQKAVERFSKVIEVEPQNASAWAQQGRAHAKLEDTAAARNSLQKALQFSNEQKRPDLKQELDQLN